MSRRLELHDELLDFSPNVYFQPPSGYRMKYPCIVYRKNRMEKRHADNIVYNSLQEYNITVIDENPDSEIAEAIQTRFEYCGIDQFFTMDNLNHVTLKLFY